jgi:hypothetical protein
MTSIDHIPGTDSIKVSVRLEYDQFLQDYQQCINDDIDLHILRSYRPFPACEIDKYINSKILIRINKKLITGKLLNSEIDGKDIRIHILYRLENKPRSITVRNTLLTGLHSDLENLTILTIENLSAEVKFIPGYTEETFDLK